jgi:hypothetical protein
MVQVSCPTLVCDPPLRELTIYSLTEEAEVKSIATPLRLAKNVKGGAVFPATVVIFWKVKAICLSYFVLMSVLVLESFIFFSVLLPLIVELVGLSFKFFPILRLLIMNPRGVK